MSKSCSQSSCHCHDDSMTMHDHESHDHGGKWKTYFPAVLSFVMLVAGMLLTHFTTILSNKYTLLVWYIIAYIPVGFPVIKEALEELKHRSFFNEFTLMVIATLGAFAIGEYPEAVAVMLFYSVGELFQHSAVDKAKRNIKALLDIRPDVASVKRGEVFIETSPEQVSIGEIIQGKPGEKVPLDGVLLSAVSSFNTSALTGESTPRTIRKDETVLAGMINVDNLIEVQVQKEYADSSLAKILDMVQNATARKAKTELLIRKFAKVYTPIVFLLAVLITVIPYFIVDGYVFSEWLYKALVFLVISCPCALVISIPLGYFGGIGAASHHGILLKGANYLDQMTHVNTIVMDKTGTLTKGVFKVVKVVTASLNESEFIALTASLESNSNHPVAKAIVTYNNELLQTATNVKEIAGRGLSGEVNGKQILAGNTKLMQQHQISYPYEINAIPHTIVIVAIDGVYAGYITIADELKEDAADAVKGMHKLGIKTIMLSGDNDAITQKTAQALGIDVAYGELLPDGKVEHMEQLKTDSNNVIAFVGDGINDTPVLALSDVGIAMGGLGSDAAIEVADVVIQTDQPGKIVTAISIAKATKSIVIQNIVMAFSIKILVMALGAFGIATMWEAVFADVGVALLAILNAVRILKKRF